MKTLILNSEEEINLNLRAISENDLTLVITEDKIIIVANRNGAATGNFCLRCGKAYKNNHLCIK